MRSALRLAVGFALLVLLLWLLEPAIPPEWTQPLRHVLREFWRALS